MTTKWTKTAKEGFTDVKPTESTESKETKETKPPIEQEVASYGNDINVGKDANELILGSNTNMTIPPPTDVPKKDDAVSKTADGISDLINNFDQTKAKKMYNDTVHYISSSIKNLPDNAAHAFLEKLNGPIDSPEAKRDLNTLSKQIARWFAVITSYIFVLNWWYILCYTNFTIDFRDYIWVPLYYVIAPTLTAIETINYYILNIRMDSNAKIPGMVKPIEYMRSLWHSRPYVFIFFHFMVSSMMGGSSVSGEATGIMTASGNGMIFTIATVLAYWYYVKMYTEEKWYEKDLYNKGFGSLILMGMSIMTFLGLPVFVSMLCVVFFTYLMFISNFSIIAFNGLNPFSSWNAVNEIFGDLRGAPVDDPNPIDFLGKFSNLAFRNAHGIYLLFMVLGGVFSLNITESTRFSSSLIMFIAVIANIFCCMFFTPSVITFIKELSILIFTPTTELQQRTPSE
jgi:hypothetical protein